MIVGVAALTIITVAVIRRKRTQGEDIHTLYFTNNKLLMNLDFNYGRLH